MRAAYNNVFLLSLCVTLGSSPDPVFLVLLMWLDFYLRSAAWLEAYCFVSWLGRAPALYQ